MDPKIACDVCGSSITKSHMARHRKRCMAVPRTIMGAQVNCPHCNQRMSKNNLARHVKGCLPPPPTVTQQHRKRSSESQAGPSTQQHRKRPAESQAGPSAKAPRLEEELREVETAFKCRLQTCVADNRNNIKDPTTFLEKLKDAAVRRVTEQVQNFNLKVNVVLLISFKREVGDKEEVQEINFKTKNDIILKTTNLSEWYTAIEKKLLKEMEDFQGKGSGWSLSKIIKLQLNINRYVPLRGSSYIDLPDDIKKKHACINIENNDQKCFLWSILSALYPVEWNRQPQRLHHYLPFEHQFDEALRDINFPISLENVPRFEKHSNISINVYSYEEKGEGKNKKSVVYPLLITKEEKEHHIDLLYYTNDTRNTHYCWIKDLGRLVHFQMTRKCNKVWICKRCLLKFGREDLLAKHKTYCQEHESVRVKMPQEPFNLISFKDYRCRMKVPFVFYADFECTLEPIATCKPHDTMEPIDKTHTPSYTMAYQHHQVVSFSLYGVHAGNEQTMTPTNYFGTDADRKFVETISEESRRIHHLYSQDAIVPMNLSSEQEEEFQKAETCHICGKVFDISMKVRDHDHLTGKFRGAAHQSCNLNYKLPPFIPIFVHNLSGYDTHLFIKMFGLNDETIEVIPNNEERYISYTVDIKNGLPLRFLDSFKFMSSSLDSLTKNLTKDQFRHTSRLYSGERLDLLLKKGVYPYDYMTDASKYEETELPPMAAFYNRLNKCGIKDVDYTHAQRVWNTFEVSNMQEYTILYNQTDVLLLADVMENFRDVCMKTYELDPAWYFTAPGLAWSAMLKTTDVTLDLLEDYEMVLMVTRGIRGGLSQCSHRHARANNPYMKEGYDSKSPTTYLTYLDANNLYGWAMSQAMPEGDFHWVDNVPDVTTVPDDSPISYILEVDLEYPQRLHDTHSDLPLAPECRSPPGSNQKKLLATLYDKERYVLHYRNLKQYIAMGMRLKLVHRVISFKQRTWLKPYIDLNTEMRTRATNSFEKDFFKLMNNSVFGKTMENIRNRVNVRLATKDTQIDKWIAQPNFKRRTVFAENLAAVHMGKTTLFFNKPIYVGMSILDISKTLMYDFHYNIIKKKYGDRAQAMYTDTDSLTYAIQTMDFYEDMKSMIQHFDTSDFPENNRFNMPRINKKVLGKMKDELCGQLLLEFVGLRSKMYANDIEDSKPTKKSKGVKKSVVENEITFSDYKQCLEDRKAVYRSMNVIRSHAHNLFSVEQYKKTLSAEDDKRYILEDGVSTLPWGHYAIPPEVMTQLALETVDACD